MRLLCEAGKVADEFQSQLFRNLNCRRIQVDELWGFCYCKEKTLTHEIAEKVPGAGNVWLW
ncbi:MAG TPA: IS1 family transposase, partial [Terriglobia bacterium]|nr:IS1 family transposase [Terriglobia bacterium]